MIEVLFVVFFMYVWFETDAFVDYGRALRLTKFLYIDDWDVWREKYPRVTYLQYVSSRHRGFFTKLMSCKSCLCFWLSALACHFGVGILWTPAVYLASLFAYNLYVFLLWKFRKS
jgi:hypothetical protein